MLFYEKKGTREGMRGTVRTALISFSATGELAMQSVNQSHNGRRVSAIVNAASRRSRLQWTQVSRCALLGLGMFSHDMAGIAGSGGRDGRVPCLAAPRDICRVPPWSPGIRRDEHSLHMNVRWRGANTSYRCQMPPARSTIQSSAR